MSSTNENNARSRPPGVLRYGMDPGPGNYRKLKDGEFYYRVELADGRETQIVAANVTVECGSLVARTENYNTIVNTIVLAPGTWVSAYMCSAVDGCSPWSILYLPEPDKR